MLPNSSGSGFVTLPAGRVSRARRRAAAALVLPLLWTCLLLTTAVASPRSPVVVVLGVEQDGRPVARARSAVLQHLLRMGESALAPAMSVDDLLCTGNDCLQRVARSFRADRLVGGEILPNDRNYIIRLWMLDVAQQQPSSIEERCIDCTPEQVYEHTALGAGKLLDAAAATPPTSTSASTAPPTAAAASPVAPPVPPETTAPEVTPSLTPMLPATAPPVASPPPAVPAPADPGAGPQLAAVPSPSTSPAPPVAPTAARCTPQFYSFGRGVAVGALSGLTALGLTTAIGLAATDGSVYLPKSAGYADDITWNNQTQYRAAYALTAATAVGLGAALIDWRKLTRKTAAPTAQCAVPRTKWTFGRGVAIGTLGSLLLGGLITSVALTALDGHDYVADGPYGRVTIPYQFHTPYSVGYAASAGLLLGLGLSIGLP